MMAEIFSRLASMPRSEMMNPSIIPLETPKTHFSGVEFDAVRSELLKSFLQVGHELDNPFGFDYDVIHVSLNGFTDEFSKTFEHTLPICSPCIFKPEWHRDVIERSERGDQ
jgi:hypothetical protein